MSWGGGPWNLGSSDGASWIYRGVSHQGSRQRHASAVSRHGTFDSSVSPQCQIIPQERQNCCRFEIRAATTLVVCKFKMFPDTLQVEKMQFSLWNPDPRYESQQKTQWRAPVFVRMVSSHGFSLAIARLATASPFSYCPYVVTSRVGGGIQCVWLTVTCLLCSWWLSKRDSSWWETKKKRTHGF